MKKALITGVAGQDGSYLSEFLLQKGYEVHGVGTACVLRLRCVVEVGHALAVDHDVFEHRTVLAGGGKDGGFVLFGEVDELGIAATFEVEHTVGAPAVFVVTDEGALRVGGKRGLPRAGEAEEDGRVFTGGVG